MRLCADRVLCADLPYACTACWAFWVKMRHALACHEPLSALHVTAQAGQAADTLSAGLDDEPAWSESDSQWEEAEEDVGEAEWGSGGDSGSAPVWDEEVDGGSSVQGEGLEDSAGSGD